MIAKQGEGGWGQGSCKRSLHLPVLAGDRAGEAKAGEGEGGTGYQMSCSRCFPLVWQVMKPSPGGQEGGGGGARVREGRATRETRASQVYCIYRTWQMTELGRLKGEGGAKALTCLMCTASLRCGSQVTCDHCWSLVCQNPRGRGGGGGSEAQQHHAVTALPGLAGE